MPTVDDPTHRHETMIAFLQMLQDRYGGPEAYLRDVVGLSVDDIAIIRRNFLSPISRS